jgi:hypothetical protein
VGRSVGLIKGCICGSSIDRADGLVVGAILRGTPLIGLLAGTILGLINGAPVGPVASMKVGLGTGPEVGFLVVGLVVKGFIVIELLWFSTVRNGMQSSLIELPRLNEVRSWTEVPDAFAVLG